MPRQRKPARLWLRPASKDRTPVYIILDAGRQVSTGCSADDGDGAEKAFAEYLGKRHLAAPRVKERPADQVTIAEVVAHYLSVRGSSVARPQELGQRVDAILDWWGDKTLDDVSSLT